MKTAHTTPRRLGRFRVPYDLCREDPWLLRVLQDGMAVWKVDVDPVTAMMEVWGEHADFYPHASGAEVQCYTRAISKVATVGYSIGTRWEPGDRPINPTGLSKATRVPPRQHVITGEQVQRAMTAPICGDYKV